MLCGVHSYSGPGLPRPTISRIDSHARALNRRYFFFSVLLGLRRGSFRRAFGFAFFFLLALLDDFGLGRRGFRGHRRFRRGLFFLLQHHHVREHALSDR